MSIKMPVKFHGSYRVVIRHGGFERRETCQKLSVVGLAGKPQGQPQEGSGVTESPTYQITYYTFGCKRILEGTLKDDREDKAVFDAQGKEYEFTPSEHIC